MTTLTPQFERARRWEKVEPGRHEIGPFTIDRETYDRHLELHGAPWASEFMEQAIREGVVPVSLLQATLGHQIAASNLFCALSTSAIDWSLDYKGAHPIFVGDPLLLTVQILKRHDPLVERAAFGTIHTHQRLYLGNADGTPLAFRKIDYTVLREGFEADLPKRWKRSEDFGLDRETTQRNVRLGSIIEPGEAKS